MIYDQQDVPLNEVLQRAALLKVERARHRTPVHYEQNVEGNRLYRILHTRLGDAYRVFRQVMRSTSSGPYNKAQENARRRPEPDLHGYEPLLDEVIQARIAAGQTQRAIAVDLGISLGKLQRTLRKYK